MKDRIHYKKNLISGPNFSTKIGRFETVQLLFDVEKYNLQPKTKETHIPIVIDPENDQIWTKTPLKFK